MTNKETRNQTVKASQETKKFVKDEASIVEKKFEKDSLPETKRKYETEGRTANHRQSSNQIMDESSIREDYLNSEAFNT